MEPGKLGLAQQTVEDVTHLMEECDDIIVSHKGRFTGSRLGKVSDHGSERVATRAARFIISSEEAPYCGVRVFRF